MLFTVLINRKLSVKRDRQGLPYFIPHRCLIKLLGTQTAFRPDIIVLNSNIKKQLFQGNSQLISTVFPELQLNINPIFNINLLK
ncbi:MAG: hypothetical protein VKJ02_06845 [Snowella sp.]|nr:hypothetical protein [Snowella sp.]